MATPSAQALDALRRADDENRARAAEVHALRQRVADAERAAAAAGEARDRAEAKALSAATEAERQTQALNVVLKEVGATKETLRQLRAENARLKEALEAASSQSREMRALLVAKAERETHDGSVAHSGAVLYMQHCYAVGADPDAGVLRSLFSRSVVMSAAGATFQQLVVLHDVVRAAPDAVDACIALDVRCTGDNVSLVKDLVASMRGITRVTARDVDASAAEGLGDALRLGSHVREVELPGLRVDDAGLRRLFTALSERFELAQQGGANAPPALIIKALDLSACTVAEPAETFATVALHSVGRLDLSNIAGLERGVLRGLLMRCGAVTSLVLRNCPKLGSDVCDVLNTCPLVRELDVTGSTGISALRLEHVVILRTSLAAVSVVNCPALVEIAEPCTHFQVVEWATPALETLALHGVTVGPREGGILAGCSMLRNLALLGCRVSGLDGFLNRMRRLEVVSFNGSRGITDTDVRALCTTVQSVDLSDAFCITDRAMSRFAECARLEELTLKRCSNVTDQGLMALESHATLRYLNVLGAKRVTVLSMHRLLETCRNLNHIVHETLVAPSIRVDRDDDEEAQRKEITTQERTLHSRLTSLSLSAVNSPCRPHSPRNVTAGSTPRMDL